MYIPVGLRIPTFLALSGCLLASCAATSESTPAAASSATDADEDDDHEVRVAELKLTKVGLEGDGARADATVSLDVARAKAAAAHAALDAFTEARAVRLDGARLDLDRAQGRATDAELELAELEAMYADEEFAEKTKELVINRGRRAVEHAQRALEIQRRKLARLKEVELPADLKKLELAVLEADAKLEGAGRACRVAELEGAIDLAQAEEALREAREEGEEEDDS